jgi:hypothetical protein
MEEDFAIFIFFFKLHCKIWEIYVTFNVICTYFIDFLIASLTNVHFNSNTSNFYCIPIYGWDIDTHQLYEYESYAAKTLTMLNRISTKNGEYFLFIKIFTLFLPYFVFTNFSNIKNDFLAKYFDNDVHLEKRNHSFTSAQKLTLSRIINEHGNSNETM